MASVTDTVAHIEDVAQTALSKLAEFEIDETASEAAAALCAALRDGVCIAEEHAETAAACLGTAAAAAGPAATAIALSALDAAHSAESDLSAVCAQLWALLLRGLASGGELSAVLADAGIGEELRSRIEETVAGVSDAVCNVANVAAEEAADAVDAISDAVGDTADAFGDAADAAADLASDAANAVGDVTDAAADLASDAADAAGDAAHIVGDALANVYDAAAPAVEDIGGVAWEALSDAYTMGAEEAQEALEVLAGAAAGCMAGLDVLSLEIVRDALQQVGLFFATMASAAFTGIAKVFGWIGNLIAVDLPYIFSSVSPRTMLIVFAVVSIVALFAGSYYVCQGFKLMPDAAQEGLESRDFEQLARDNPRTMKGIKYTLTLLGFIYLPVSKLAIQVLACSDKDHTMVQMESAGVKCADVKGFAGLLLVLVTLGVPCAMYALVQRAKPVGSLKDPNMCYDDDGLNLIPFTDHLYQKRLKQDPSQLHSPFLFLYQGFERRWAYYKAALMVVKLLLALPAVLLVGNLSGQAAATLLVLIGYAGMVFYTTPYLESRKDKSESCGRIAAVLTVIFGAIAGSDPDGAAAGACRALVFLCNVLSFGAMAVFTLLGCTCVHNRMQNFYQTLEFTDTVTDAVGDAPSILPGLDATLELRHRVWWPFWDGLMLRGYGDDVARRLHELKMCTVNDGLAKVKAHFDDVCDSSVAAERHACCTELEGVDVYWDGVGSDGEPAPGSCFGKMWVKRYPFCPVVVWDDDVNRHAFLDTKEGVHALVERNADDEVQRRKGVREKLRALCGKQVHLEHSAEVSRQVRDGTETVTVGEGDDQHTETRDVYSTVTVTLYFHNGTLHVNSHNDEKQMQAGFAVSVAYADGEGQCIKPRTGETAYFSNESWTAHAQDLDITGEYVICGKLEELLGDEANAAVAEVHIPEVRRRAAEYRAECSRIDAAKEATLASSFWLRVYANDKLTLEQLRAYLSDTSEVPAGSPLATLADEHSVGLEYVFSRMKLARSHPAAAFWLAFWQNLWSANQAIVAISANGAKLNPKQRGCVAYRPMRREELEAELASCDPPLLTGNSKKLISNSVLDALYLEMERRSTPALAPVPRGNLEQALAMQPAEAEV